MRIIDADTVVTVQVFDEMYEEYNLKTMTIAEALDLWTEEGCPSSAEPNYETDTEVRLSVTNRKKEKVILWDAFGEVEYYPIEALQTDAEPKWSCTANFVAEQLDLLRKMTDEEKWNFFREFFGMGEAVDENEDYVSVVRCKNCQYRKKVGTSYYCELDEFNVKDADFCSWGERREK